MPTSETNDDKQPLRAMTVAEVAEYLSITQQSVWAAVREGRLPQPIYPASRAPRWFRSEIDAAIERTRQLPSEAAAARRARRLADARSTATAA